MDTSRSSQLFAQAQGYIPGGVNSPVRSFKSVGGVPLFIQRGQGSHIWDADGNELGRESAHIARQSHDGSVIALVEALPEDTAAISLETTRGEVIYAPAPR